MKNHRNMTNQQNKSPLTDLQEIKICELSDREFKMKVLKKHGKL